MPTARAIRARDPEVAEAAVRHHMDEFVLRLQEAEESKREEHEEGAPKSQPHGADVRCFQ